MLLKKIMIFLCMLLLFPISAHAEEYRSIEIFDINQGQVVKELDTNSRIQGLAENYIKGIKGLYPKFDPIPTKGFAVRVPLDPPFKTQINNRTSTVDEIIVMFPENESPFLMAFEDDSKLLCYSFSGDTDSLLKLIQYDPQK